MAESARVEATWKEKGRSSICNLKTKDGEIQSSRIYLVVYKCGETSVVGPFAHSSFPGQALDPGREVPIGEDVRQAKVGKVHSTELFEVDLLGLVAGSAKVEENPDFLHPEVDVAKLMASENSSEEGR